MTYRPGKMFRVGQMRDRITVSTEVQTQDTAGQPIVSLSTWLADEPASYEYISGGETTRGRQVEAGIQAVFIVRYRDGYRTQMKITMSGQAYGIVHVVPVEGKSRYLELHCKAVA
jgi:SPP1 family predicted phage head-tail adaptor